MEVENTPDIAPTEYAPYPPLNLDPTVDMHIDDIRAVLDAADAGSLPEFRIATDADMDEIHNALSSLFSDVNGPHVESEMTDAPIQELWNGLRSSRILNTPLAGAYHEEMPLGYHDGGSDEQGADGDGVYEDVSRFDEDGAYTDIRRDVMSS